MMISKHGATWCARGRFNGRKVHAIGPTKAQAWAALIDLLAGVWV